MNIVRIFVFLITLLLTASFCLSVMAENNAVRIARQAADRLNEAILSLEKTNNAKDRIKALTATIRAFELGLLAMRDGLRKVTLRERAIIDKLQQKNDQLSQFIGALITFERAAIPMLFMHPTSIIDTVHSAIIMQDITPKLQENSKKLRQQLQEIQLLHDIQSNAKQQLQISLTSLQKARASLNQAISQRSNLPEHYGKDPIHIQILAENSNTLKNFIQQIKSINFTTNVIPQIAFIDAKGQLPLPSVGSLLRNFNQPDAAGIKRPGIVIITPALSLVTAPWAATVRYAGNFLNYEKVIILEPDVDYLLILAGLSKTFVKAGDVVKQDDPIGLLGGNVTQVNDFLINATQLSGKIAQETLYLEIRHNTKPIDPLPWFKQAFNSGIDK